MGVCKGMYLAHYEEQFFLIGLLNLLSCLVGFL